MCPQDEGSFSLKENGRGILTALGSRLAGKHVSVVCVCVCVCVWVGVWVCMWVWVWVWVHSAHMYVLLHVCVGCVH